MQNSEYITSRIPLKGDVSSENLSLNNLEERSCEVAGKELRNYGKEDVSVPFFSGSLSLSQVQEMQRCARKRTKLPAIKKKPNDENTHSSGRIQFMNTNITPKNESLPSSYIEKCFDGVKEHQSNLNSPGNRGDSSNSSSKLINRMNKSSKNSTKKLEKHKHKVGDDGRVKGKQPTSYLEQYRKKKDMKNGNSSPGSINSSMRTICSERSQMSLNMSSSSQVDLEKSEVGDNCLYCSSSEERLYREIIDSDRKTHSSAKSSFVSCKSSMVSDEDAGQMRCNDGLPVIKSRKGDEKTAKKSLDNERGRAEKRTKVTLEREVNVAKIPPIPLRLARSLGPDLEAIKPKLDALQKRNEYGNKMSCLNRDNIQQKHSRDNNGTQSTSNDEEVIPIPITNYSLEQIDSNRLLKKKSPKVPRQKKRMNSTNSTNVSEDFEDPTNSREVQLNSREVQLMIERHQEEKKLAENIRNQLMI